MKRWWFSKGAVVASSTVLVSALALGACDQEMPTGVGSGLLPPGVIQTFEVVIDADDFLVFDTAFGLYSDISDASFGYLANQYRGELDSRVLVRYDLPAVIRVRNAAGTLVTDSTPEFTMGDVMIRVDSLGTYDNSVIQLHHATESWDRQSANWTFRVDTAGVQLRWSEPGGSRGALIGEGAFENDADTIGIPVSAADLAQWADTTNNGRGLIISLGTAGARLRTAAPVLRLSARSELQPDTVVEVTLSPNRTVLSSPELGPQASGLRVGGTPAWRGVMRLRPGLDTVTVPCPSSPTCRVALGNVTVSYAGLLLQPVPSAGGRDPELPVSISAHLMLPTSQVPLQRSPITAAVGRTTQPIPASSFGDEAGPIVELPLTELLGLVLSDPPPGQVLPSYVALAQSFGETFGFASFAEGPRLRLILSSTQEIQLP